MNRIPPFPSNPTDGMIVLRPWRQADSGALTTACRDAEIQRWTMVPDGYTEAHARSFITASEARRRAGTSLEVGVVDASDEAEVLGAVGLVSIAWDHGRAEVGYWTAPHARRRGIATRAVRLLSAWAFEGLSLARLEVTSHAENHASQRVAGCAGYTREAGRRSRHTSKRGPVEVVIFSLLCPGPLDRG